MLRTGCLLVPRGHTHWPSSPQFSPQLVRAVVWAEERGICRGKEECVPQGVRGPGQRESRGRVSTAVTGGPAGGGSLTRLGQGCPTQQDDKGSRGTTKENSSFRLRTLRVPV